MATVISSRTLSKSKTIAAEATSVSISLAPTPLTARALRQSANAPKIMRSPLALGDQFTASPYRSMRMSRRITPTSPGTWLKLTTTVCSDTMDATPNDNDHPFVDVGVAYIGHSGQVCRMHACLVHQQKNFGKSDSWTTPGHVDRVERQRLYRCDRCASRFVVLITTQARQNQDCSTTEHRPLQRKTKNGMRQSLNPADVE